MDKEGQFITHYKMEVIIAYEGQQQLQYKAPIVILVLTPNFAHEHFITCTIKLQACSDDYCKIQKEPFYGGFGPGLNLKTNALNRYEMTLFSK